MTRSRDHIASMLIVFLLLAMVFGLLQDIDQALFRGFATVFLSILVEALPFVLAGVLVSSLIQHLVSEEIIRRIFPRHKFPALLAAAGCGLLFPLCECGIIPVARRLALKGVPVYAAVTFMLAVPVVNPIVAASTYYAFPGQPGFAVLRVLLGALVAIWVGYALSFVRGNVLRMDAAALTHNDGCACGCHHGRHEEKEDEKTGFMRRAFAILDDAAGEFLGTAKYVIIGATIAAVLQTSLPRALLLSIGRGPVASVLTMMALAFVLSLCSEADAFVAASLRGTFAPPALMAFLLLGPMLDIKNLLMMLGSFRRRFVAGLAALIIACVFIACVCLYAFDYLAGILGG